MNKCSNLDREKGKGSYYIETYGCTANKVDTEIMVGLLNSNGYVKSSLEKAEYVIINTCGVKSPTEEKIIHRLKQLSELDKKIIVAGCLPKINLKRIRKVLPEYSALIGPKSINKINKVFEKIEEGHQITLISKETPIKPKFNYSNLDKYIGRVSIGEGCLSNCSYCCTKFSRGKLFSYPLEDILKKVKSLVKSGHKEIRLTSQDTVVYGLDKNNSLPILLNHISEIQGKFRIRVGMMNPRFAKTKIEELIRSYNNEKIYKFLHIPVQSGDDFILKKMKRGYSVDNFLEIVEEFRTVYPNITIWTDIIIGFPGESQKQFYNTINLIKTLKPDVVNISKFYPRPKTEASKMKFVPTKTIKKRSKKLTEVFNEISYNLNKKWLGKKVKVLILEQGKNGLIGRTDTYKSVFLPKYDKSLLGKFLKVKIKRAKTNYLIGKEHGS